jgi:hypothetical protein
MKLQLASLALILLAGPSTHAATIAGWTFEDNTPADLINSSSSPLAAADIGNGNGSGTHASGNSDWTTPSGNGSVNSFSANTWGVGDFWQFQVSTRGFADIRLSWDQASSGTGPKDFTLQFSTTGTTFSDFVSYVVSVNPSTSPNWNSTTYRTGFLLQMDLSQIDSIEDRDSVYFRLVNTTTVKADGTTGNVAAGGSSRIDNFTVSGTEIQRAPVAAPDVGGSFLLLSLALGGLVGVHRRGMAH